MSTKTSHFCEKTAEKTKVKHAYWLYPVDLSFACNSMKILIDNLILITVDKEHHATSYHSTVKVQRHTFLSSLELWAKEESIGDPIMSFNVIFSRG